MSNKPDGGRAFPFTETWRSKSGDEVHRVEHAGMSLRDYFAAHAMDLEECDPARCASEAYLKADAMLAEREKTQ